jgi:hypothetical protein
MSSTKLVVRVTPSIVSIKAEPRLWKLCRRAPFERLYRLVTLFHCASVVRSVRHPLTLSMAVTMLPRSS